MEVLAQNTGRCLRLAGWLLLGSLMASPAMVFGQSMDEYEVKAAFLFNFTKFIEFPQLASTSSFNICVFGDDPFGSTIDKLTKGKTASGHPLEIRRLKGTADVQQCQIVFVRRGEEGRASKLVEAVRGMAVLTVGESRDFAVMGGMSYLAMEDNHVKVFINANAAKSAGMNISAKLLSLASIIKNEEKAEK